MEQHNLMIDVAIATKNRIPQFKKALLNLNETNNADKLSIFILDGNNSPEIKDFINNNPWEFNSISLWKDSDVPKLKKRPGCWPIMYNFLLRKGRSNYLTYWSDDILIGRDFLEKAVIRLDRSGEKTAYSNFYFWFPEFSKAYPILIVNNTRIITLVFGVMRRSAFEDVGGISEDYDFYYSDNDISNKLYSKGYKSIINGDCIVNHIDPKLEWKSPLCDDPSKDSDCAKHDRKWGKDFLAHHIIRYDSINGIFPVSKAIGKEKRILVSKKHPWMAHHPQWVKKNSRVHKKTNIFPKIDFIHKFINGFYLMILLFFLLLGISFFIGFRYIADSAWSLIILVFLTLFLLIQLESYRRIQQGRESQYYELHSLGHNTNMSVKRLVHEVNVLKLNTDWLKNGLDRFSNKIFNLDQNMESFENTLKNMQIGGDYRFQQIQALLSLFNTLKINNLMPLMDDISTSADFCKVLASIILNKPPEIIVELGSDPSTLVMGYALKKAGKGKLISFEHNRHKLENINKEIKNHGLGNFCQVIYAPLTDVKIKTRNFQWYNPKYFAKIRNIDLLVVGGPVDLTQKQVKYPAMHYLYSKMRAGSHILMDNVKKDGGDEIIKKWLNEFTSLEYEFMDNKYEIGILKKKHS